MRTGRLWVGASLGMALLLGSQGLQAQERLTTPRRSGTTGITHSTLPSSTIILESKEEHEEGGHEEAEEGHDEKEEGGGLFLTAEALLIKARRRPHDFAILDGVADRSVAGQVQQFDWETVIGYRLGAGYKLEHGWEIGGVYTYLHSDDQVGLFRPTNGELYATLSAPITFDSAASALGSSNLDFDVVDVELAKRWCADENLWLRLTAGTRLATIQQKQEVVYDFTPVGLGFSNVSTRIQFDGIGPRVGGEGFMKCCGNVGFWAKLYGSAMAGDFKNSLTQFVNDGRSIIVDVHDKHYKVVPVLEAAVGLGWKGENLSLTVGYEIQNFFGMVDLIDFPDQATYKNSYRTGDLSLEALTVQLGIAY